MYSMKNLTPRRTAILTFIRDRIAQQGQSPSLAEIAEAFGFASRSVARKHVLALTEAALSRSTPTRRSTSACSINRRGRSCWIFRCSAGWPPVCPLAPMPKCTTVYCSTRACSRKPRITCCGCRAIR